MLSALGWGALAASSLVLGGLLGTWRPWREQLVGIVLAFGAGALISAVAFDLVEEGGNVGGPLPLAIGLAAGAIGYFTADRLVQKMSPGPGSALALGALLDGLPEQAVLGIGLASGGGVSLSLIVAIFVSNLPEAIGASSDLHHAGRSKGTIRRLWVIVAVACTLATVAGYAVA